MSWITALRRTNGAGARGLSNVLHGFFDAFSVSALLRSHPSNDFRVAHCIRVYDPNCNWQWTWNRVTMSDGSQVRLLLQFLDTFACGVSSRGVFNELYNVNMFTALVRLALAVLVFLRCAYR